MISLHDQEGPNAPNNIEIQPFRVVWHTHTQDSTRDNFFAKSHMTWEGRGLVFWAKDGMMGCSLVLGFRVVLITTSNGWKIQNHLKLMYLSIFETIILGNVWSFQKDLFFWFFFFKEHNFVKEGKRIIVHNNIRVLHIKIFETT
jgi:hypothetical protein